MFSWFQHQQLVKKGLACDKTRRQRPEGDWANFFNVSTTVKLALFSVFAVLLYGISFWSSSYHSNEIHLLTFIVFISAIMFLQMDAPAIWASNSKIGLLFGTIFLNLIVNKLVFLWVAPEVGPLRMEVYFLLPCALAPFLISLLLGRRSGLYAVLVLSLFNALLLRESFALLMIGLITGFTAVYFTRRTRKRSDLIKAGFAVGVASLLCALAFGLVRGHSMDALLEQAGIGIGMGLATAMVVSAILPLFETPFGIITDISWIEMADLNHPLLQQMMIEAPGTYHHSLMVANLLEGAANALDMNPTQCRVLAYFHDIGKIIKPEYFTENAPPDHNPHDNLSPSMSALIIIAHVKEGVDLGLKARLKKPIIDAIQQHHGDSVILSFYKRAKRLEEDAREGVKIMNMREEDIPHVSENSFRYPGPKPQSKEVGLLSLADAVEAASRSLDRPTPQKIESLVADVMRRKIAEGLLDESHLTLNEIRATAESFVFTVKNMLHNRISYPKDEKSAAASGSQPAKKSSTVRHAPSTQARADA